MKKLILVFLLATVSLVSNLSVAATEVGIQVIVDLGVVRSKNSTELNISQEMYTWIDNLNQYYENSSVAIVAKLENIEFKEISGANPTNARELLVTMRNESGKFVGLQSRMKQVGADYTAVIVLNPTDGIKAICGMASTVSRSIGEIATFGSRLFVSGFFCGADTFAHELGHTFGLAHGDAVATCNNNTAHSSALNSYAKGYSNADCATPNPVGTIMVGNYLYYNMGGGTPIKVPMFSNPALKCINATGLDCGSSTNANAARALNGHAQYYANFATPLGNLGWLNPVISLLLEEVSCNYSVTPTSQSIPSTGGSFSMSVSTMSTCGWTLASVGGVAQSLSKSSGSGNATVTYQVAANTISSVRNGSIVLTSSSNNTNQKTLSLTQAAKQDTKPGISVANVSTTEGAAGTTKALRFTIKLNKASTTSISVKYATQNGTAVAGTDYVAKSGTVTFSAGQTSKAVDISIKGDSTKESNETFKLVLSAPTSPYTLLVGSATGTIMNDD